MADRPFAWTAVVVMIFIGAFNAYNFTQQRELRERHHSAWMAGVAFAVAAVFSINNLAHFF